MTVAESIGLISWTFPKELLESTSYNSYTWFPSSTKKDMTNGLKDLLMNKDPQLNTITISLIWTWVSLRTSMIDWLIRWNMELTWIRHNSLLCWMMLPTNPLEEKTTSDKWFPTKEITLFWENMLEREESRSSNRRSRNSWWMKWMSKTSLLKWMLEKIFDSIST